MKGNCYSNLKMTSEMGDNMKTEKKTGHTPGPWKVSAGKFIEIRKDEGVPVLLATMTPHLPINGIDQEANARVMAAAAELLETANVIASVEVPSDEQWKAF